MLLCQLGLKLFGLFSLLSCTLCFNHLLLVVELTQASLDQVCRRVSVCGWLIRHGWHEVKSLRLARAHRFLNVLRQGAVGDTSGQLHVSHHACIGATVKVYIVQVWVALLDARVAPTAIVLSLGDAEPFGLHALRMKLHLAHQVHMSHGDFWSEVKHLIELPEAVLLAIGRAAHLEFSRGRVVGGVGHAGDQARPWLRHRSIFHNFVLI